MSGLEGCVESIRILATGNCQVSTFTAATLDELGGIGDEFACAEGAFGARSCHQGDTATFGSAPEYDNIDTIGVSDCYGKIANTVSVESFDPLHDDAVDCFGSERAGLANRELTPQVGDLGSQRLDLGHALVCSIDDFRNWHAQDICHLSDAGFFLAEPFNWSRAGHSLDATNA